VTARNLKIGRGELDIVVRFGGEPAVVEVRSIRETGTLRPNPLEVFTDRKVTQVRTLARLLRPPVYRIDLVAVHFRKDGIEVRWLPRVG